jgi:ketosteroid isomerase-like protein
MESEMLKKFKKIILGSVLGAVFTSTSMAQTTNEVWNHHIHAWQTRNLDAIVSDYSEDSVLILNNHVFKGTRAIKNVFTRLKGIEQSLWTRTPEFLESDS